MYNTTTVRIFKSTFAEFYHKKRVDANGTFNAVNVEIRVLVTLILCCAGCTLTGRGMKRSDLRHSTK
jgi:hypothetical protein